MIDSAIQLKLQVTQQETGIKLSTQQLAAQLATIELTGSTVDMGLILGHHM